MEDTMKHVFIKLTLLALMVALAGCGQISDDTVAKVGKFEISVADYKSELAKKFSKKESYADVDSSLKMDILNNMIEGKLFLNEAYDQDLDEDPAIMGEFTKRKESIIGNKYYERNVVDIVISEEDLQNAFNRKKEEVKASHVLIGFKGAAKSKATRTKEEAKKLADQISKKAKAGKSIKLLAEKYSDDPSAKQNKGDLGYFSWGSMVGPFQETAFSMKPGEISEPVLTSFGYHVIKVEDKRDNPKFKADNFNSAKLRLKQELYRGVQKEAKAVWDTLVSQLKTKHDYKIDEENVKKINTLIEEKLKKGKISIKDFDNSEKSVILATWDDDNCDLGYVIDYYGPRLAQYGKSLTTFDKLKDVVGNFSTNKIIVSTANNEGYETDPEVKVELEKLNATIEAKMIRKAEQLLVNNAVEIDDEELQKYYDEHQDSFKKQAEMEVWEIYLTSKKQADKLLKQAKNGKNFEKLAGKYTEDSYYKKKNGYLGFIKSFSRGDVSKKALAAGSNAFVGPIKYKKGWVILKTGLEKPERVKTFEEAKGLARSKCKSEKMKNQKEEVRKDLHDSYSIEINEKILGKI